MCAKFVEIYVMDTIHLRDENQQSVLKIFKGEKMSTVYKNIANRVFWCPKEIVGETVANKTFFEPSRKRLLSLALFYFLSTESDLLIKTNSVPVWWLQKSTSLRLSAPNRFLDTLTQKQTDSKLKQGEVTRNLDFLLSQMSQVGHGYHFGWYRRRWEKHFERL